MDAGYDTGRGPLSPVKIARNGNVLTDNETLNQSEGPQVGNERFLKLTDVSVILNISASQTYALVRTGDLKGIQIGGRNQWRVERAALGEYIAEAYRKSAESLKDLPAVSPDPNQ